MKLDKYIERFNQPDVHLVVSPWPEKVKKGESYHGDGVFTRETLKVLTKNHSMRFIVLSDMNHDNKPQVLNKKQLLLLRIFDHTRLHLYPTVLLWLKKFDRIKHVTVHSNFATGGIKHFVLLIPFLAAIKLTGRRVTHIAHNVLDTIDFIAPQLDVQNKFVLRLLNKFIKLYNVLIGWVTDEVVVLDAHGYEILSNFLPSKKLYYSPHWAKPKTTHWTKRTAKKSLGIDPETTVIMSFGFVSWYKGSDKIVELFNKQDASDTHLIMAGGPAPSMQQKPHYQAFYNEFQKQVDDKKNITHTGFIPEKELGKYFAAADMVILPYRGLMGGSGALGHAIGYGKPFVVSTPMNGLLKNADVYHGLQKAGIKKEQLLFDLTPIGIKQVIKSAGNTKQLRRLSKLTHYLRLTRDIEAINEVLYNDLYRGEDEKAPLIRYARSPVTA